MEKLDENIIENQKSNQKVHPTYHFLLQRRS